MVQIKKKSKPEKILLGDDLYILWRDGHESRYRFFDLRDACPCASCVDEITGKKTLDRSSIPENIHAESCEYVGNYAIRIRWSDGHDTGLYNFRLLRNKDGATQDTESP